VVDVGDGVRTYEIEATRNGRRVESAIARGTLEVNEVTRTGQVVRTARFMSTRVVAVVEHPAADENEPAPRRRRKGPGENQADLGLA
jgi:hypothetical protein